MPSKIFFLTTKNDAEKFLKRGRPDETAYPLTQKAWAVIFDKIDPFLPPFWELQRSINFPNLDKDFQNYWPEWVDCVSHFCDQFSNGEDELGDLNLALTDAIRPYMWGRIRETRYVEAAAVALFKSTVGAIKEIHCFAPRENMRGPQLFCADALEIGLANAIKGQDITLSVHRDSEDMSNTSSTIELAKIRPSGEFKVVILTTAMSDLAAKIVVLGQSSQRSLIVTTPEFSSDIREIESIVDLYPNLEATTFEAESRWTSYPSSDMVDALTQILEKSTIPVSLHPVYLGVLRRDVARNMSLLAQAREDFEAFSAEAVYLSDHAVPESVAFMNAAVAKGCRIDVFAHSLWPLHDARNLDFKGFPAFYHWPTRSAAKHSKRLPGARGAMQLCVKVDPPRDLRSSFQGYCRRRLKRVFQRVFRRSTPNVLGVIFTSGMENIASDFSIIEELEAASRTLRRSNTSPLKIIFRYRGSEDSKAALKAMSIAAGFTGFLEFESSSARPIFAFIAECFAIVEIGVASSATSLAINYLTPCARLTRQPAHRERFKGRAVPVLSVSSVQLSPARFLNSDRYRNRLQRQQYYLLRADTQSGPLS